MKKRERLCGIELRLRTEKERQESPDKYVPKEDYIKYINEKKKELGFMQGNGRIASKYNSFNNVLSGGRLEANEMVRSTRKNFWTIIKERFSSIKRIEENSNDRIERILADKSFLNRKNPYADKKFGLAVASFQKQGLTQYELKEILSEFANSKNGSFLRDRVNQLDLTPIKEKGIHGIKHNDRVAILSLLIGQGEGIIKEESTRERELLTMASYYHDIGRITDIGPHAKRSARKIGKLKLKYLDGKKFSEEDKKIVQLLAEGHEGNDNKIEKLLEKYQINEEDKSMTKSLLKILKDADALDRSRLTVNTPFITKTDLDPKYLRLDTSKRLMEVSYGLESLSHNNVNNTDVISYHCNNKEHYYHKKTLTERINVDEHTRILPDSKHNEVKKTKDREVDNIR